MTNLSNRVAVTSNVFHLFIPRDVKRAGSLMRPAERACLDSNAPRGIESTIGNYCLALIYSSVICLWFAFGCSPRRHSHSVPRPFAHCGPLIRLNRNLLTYIAERRCSIIFNNNNNKNSFGGRHHLPAILLSLCKWLQAGKSLRGAPNGSPFAYRQPRAQRPMCRP